MNRKQIFVSTMLFVMAASSALGMTGDGTPPVTFVMDPDFWLSTSINVVGTALFLTRVHWPAASKWFGYGTELLGIPALVFGILDITHGTVDFSTWAKLAYSAWALYAFSVDHIFQIEYRDPRKPGIIVPYVVAYYIGIGTLAAAQFGSGIAPWAVAGVTCIAAVAASFYARAKGAD